MEVFDADFCDMDPSPDSEEPPKKRKRCMGVKKKDKSLVLETLKQYNMESLASHSPKETKAKLQVHKCNFARSLSAQLEESELCFII